MADDVGPEMMGEVLRHSTERAGEFEQGSSDSPRDKRGGSLRPRLADCDSIHERPEYESSPLIELFVHAQLAKHPRAATSN